MNAINHMGKRVLFDTSAICNDYLRECTDQALKKLFCYFLPLESGDIALTFVFTDRLDSFFQKGDGLILSENAKVNNHQLFVTGHGNRYGYEFDDEKRLVKVYYELVTPSRINNTKSRVTSRAFLSSVESQVNSFYTRGYLNSIQQVNLFEGGSFLHACSFCVGEDAYLVSATPGAGKSSLLLSLRFTDGLKDIRFISDDFSTIDSKGHTHQIGRAMAMKSHQLQYFPQLEYVVQNMSWMQRMQWFLLKRRNLKYFLSPTELFGDNVVTDKHVRHVIYMTNHNKKVIEHEDMSVAEFARLNANMLFSELYLGMEVFNHALELPYMYLVGNVAYFIEKTQVNIQTSLKDCSCTLVKVPFRSDPRETLSYLLRNGLIRNDNHAD